jgi:hypothetical protein
MAGQNISSGISIVDAAPDWMRARRVPVSGWPNRPNSNSFRNIAKSFDFGALQNSTYAQNGRRASHVEKNYV